MNEKPDLKEAIADLDKNIDHLGESVQWAADEINRLRAENLRLELKVQNLTYMLRAVTQGAVNGN